MTWGEGLAGWWVAEIEDDPVYRNEVIPLTVGLVAPRPGRRYLDLGCGEGQVMRALADFGCSVIGVDLDIELATIARADGPTVVGRLPLLPWVKNRSLDGAVAVLVLEHLDDLDSFFAETHRVVAPGGTLTVIANHPAFTAPQSGPVVDVTDGEMLWRWGPYLDRGRSEVPAGEGLVTFHHRPMGMLLSSAAESGWQLNRMIERAAIGDTARPDELLEQQRHIPRLVGIRWQSG